MTSNDASIKFKENTYKTYSDKITKLKEKPISQKSFFILIDKTVSILQNMMVSQKCESPYIIVKIDEFLNLYVSISRGNLTVNVWDKMQTLYLTGAKVSGGII